MGRILTTEEEWAEQLQSFEHTAFRLEQQREYWEPEERATIERFIAGNPEPPDQVPEFRPWFELVARHAAERKRMERVRIHEDPPTPVQRWLRYIDPWNTKAGETIRYMTRQRAYEVGLLPALGADDWWLFDSCRLLVMRFDGHGHRVENELITDPERVVQACAWRDLAVHHSTSDIARGRAA